MSPCSGERDGQRPRGRPRRFAASPERRLETPSAAVVAIVAEGPVARLLGLAALDRDPVEALLIPRCRSVHTFWMRFAIDVAFLDLPAGAGWAPVLAVRRAIGPRRLAAAPRGAAMPGRGRIAALELAAGEAARLGIEAGVELRAGAGGGGRGGPAGGRRPHRD